MISLVCEQKLKEELSDFYHTIDEMVLQKLKDLCVIHNITEDVVCAQLLAFVMKSDQKNLTLEVLEDFQKDYLDKKAINDYKKAKTLATKSCRTPKNSSLGIRFTSDGGLEALMNGFNECEDNKPKYFTPKGCRSPKDSSLNSESVSDPQMNELIDSKTNPKLTTKIEIASIEDEDQSVSTSVTTEDLKPEKTIETIDETSCGQGVFTMTSPVVNHNESIDTSFKFSASMNSNTLCFFGNSYSDTEWRNRSKDKHKIELYDKSISLTEKYKFMSLKIMESNEILNDIIDEFSELLRQKLDIEGWSQFSTHCPSESYFIGRVCYECDKSKLDEHSVRIEGSSYTTNNESIGLDLSRLTNYSLFPGQVIAVKAINHIQKSLIVEEMIDFDKITVLPNVLPTLKQPLDIVVGAGPFNLPNSLSVDPLKKMMKYVKEYEPHFCILLGPFVDSMNEKLLTSEEPIDHFFNSQMRFISNEIKNVRTEVIVIPSQRDLNVFNVLPTMAFDSLKSQKMHFFSNPTILNINGVIVGMTATDVLLHMSKEEISGGQNIDRLSRLCKHIINQRSFYPIFPPKPEINLEFTKYDFLRLPVSPHLLILPSDLKEFVKNISGSVAINSGRVFKGKFARIRIDSIDPKTSIGSLEGYTNVEIVKFND